VVPSCAGYLKSLLRVARRSGGGGLKKESGITKDGEGGPLRNVDSVVGKTKASLKAKKAGGSKRANIGTATETKEPGQGRGAARRRKSRNQFSGRERGGIARPGEKKTWGKRNVAPDLSRGPATILEGQGTLLAHHL